MGLLLLIGEEKLEILPHNPQKENLWLRSIMKDKWQIGHNFFCDLISVNCVRDMESDYNYFSSQFLAMLVTLETYFVIYSLNKTFWVMLEKFHYKIPQFLPSYTCFINYRQQNKSNCSLRD